MSKTKINFSNDLSQQIDWINENLETERIYHFALQSGNRIGIQSLYNTIDARKLIDLDFEKRVTNSGFVEFSKVIGDYYFEITFTD